MTQQARIWDSVVTDCSKCQLSLLDAIIGATDSDIFEVNCRTGVKIQVLSDIREACKCSAKDSTSCHCLCEDLADGPLNGTAAGI